MKIGVLLLLAVPAFLSSCATLPEQYDVKVKEDYTVAVLPIYNATNDIDGPELVRKVFNEKIQRYYKSKPLKEVDRLLRDQMGITLGGQLDLTTPQKLGEVLGVDGVIYGYLLNFDDITTVLYNARKVRAGFKLVDTKTGNVVWARGQGVRSITGIAEIPSEAERMAPFMSIKDIEKIPGIHEWYDLVNLPQAAASQSDSYAAVGIMAFAAASTVLSLGTHLFGEVLDIHLITETRIMADRIVHTVGSGKKMLAEPVTRVPRLIFPAYSVFGYRDFSAVISMTTINRSTQEGVTRRIELAKLGNKIRTNRVSDGTILSVIINKDAKKGYLIYHNRNRYMEVNLDDSHFQGIKIVKEFFGEDVVDSSPCVRYRIAVIYPDGYIQEGLIWEAKDLDGFVKRLRIKDKDSKVIIELENISFETPPETIFEVPKDYSKETVY